LEGLGAFWGGAKPTKAPRGDGTVCIVEDIRLVYALTLQPYCLWPNCV